MQIFWVILVAIIWAVISAANKQKKQQAKREAEAKAAAGPQPARPAPAPARPVARQSVAPPPTTVMKSNMSIPRGEGRQSEMTSSLTELAHTKQHTLAPSHEMGHAHQETSMTGFEPDCPPVGVRNSAKAADVPQVTEPDMPVFIWRQDAVLDGLIYAEILSKPKALRG